MRSRLNTFPLPNFMQFSLGLINSGKRIIMKLTTFYFRCLTASCLIDRILIGSRDKHLELENKSLKVIASVFTRRAVMLSWLHLSKNHPFRTGKRRWMPFLLRKVQWRMQFCNNYCFRHLKLKSIVQRLECYDWSKINSLLLLVCHKRDLRNIWFPSTSFTSWWW